jgi:hypothetical protein
MIESAQASSKLAPIMKQKFLLFGMVLALGAGLLYGQQAIFKGLTAGAGLKVGAGGIAAERTTGTATSTAAAATLNTDTGKITTEALTTAGLASYTFTLTNSLIAATSKIFVSVENGTNTQGTLGVGTIAPGAGSAVILIRNLHATQALNGTIKFNFYVVQ